jgi:hypothetical protein
LGVNDASFPLILALSAGLVFLPTPLIRPVGQPNLGLAILPLPRAKGLGEREERSQWR